MSSRSLIFILAVLLVLAGSASATTFPIAAANDDIMPTGGASYSACTNGFTLNSEHNATGPVWSQMLLKWPATNTLGAGFTPVSASVIFYSNGKSDAGHGRSLVCEWVDWSAGCGAGFWSQGTGLGTTAGSVTIASWPSGSADITMTLTDFSGINPTGTTYLRCYLNSSGGDTGDDKVIALSKEWGGAYLPIRLVVNAAPTPTPTSTPTPTPTPTRTPTPTIDPSKCCQSGALLCGPAIWSCPTIIAGAGCSGSSGVCVTPTPTPSPTNTAATATPTVTPTPTETPPPVPTQTPPGCVGVV